MAAYTTYYDIDLDAIAFNWKSIQAQVGPDVALMPVVKANAYGHGAVPVARLAQAQGIQHLAVNRVLEGVELRRAGVTLPILVLGYAIHDELPYVVQHDLTPTVTEVASAQTLSDLAGAVSKNLKVHVKIDTGMGRFGLLPNEALSFIKQLATLPYLTIEGVFTHFSVAESAQPDDVAYTNRQLELFTSVLADVQATGIEILMRHTANSAGTMYHAAAHFDLVRPGIATYLALFPDAGRPSPFPIKPALSLKSHVARIRTLPTGAAISYGRTYVTTRSTTVALVIAGYGDGYHRRIGNRGAVLINGRRAPIVGTVCMDQFVVDISEVGDVALEDEVVIVGQQGHDQITAEEVAAWAGTINYEVVTSMLHRAPRRYWQGGEVVAEVDGVAAKNTLA